MMTTSSEGITPCCCSETVLLAGPRVPCEQMYGTTSCWIANWCAPLMHMVQGHMHACGAAQLAVCVSVAVQENTYSLNVGRRTLFVMQVCRAYSIHCNLNARSHGQFSAARATLMPFTAAWQLCSCKCASLLDRQPLMAGGFAVFASC